MASAYTIAPGVCKWLKRVLRANFSFHNDRQVFTDDGIYWLGS